MSENEKPQLTDTKKNAAAAFATATAAHKAATDVYDAATRAYEEATRVYRAARTAYDKTLQTGTPDGPSDATDDYAAACAAFAKACSDVGAEPV